MRSTWTSCANSWSGWTHALSSRGCLEKRPLACSSHPTGTKPKTIWCWISTNGLKREMSSREDRKSGSDRSFPIFPFGKMGNDRSDPDFSLEFLLQQVSLHLKSMFRSHPRSGLLQQLIESVDFFGSRGMSDVLLTGHCHGCCEALPSAVEEEVDGNT